MIEDQVSGMNHQHLIQVPYQPSVVTSEEYFKEAGITVMCDNFREQFLGRFVSAVESDEFSFKEVDKTVLDNEVTSSFAKKIEIAISQFKVILEKLKTDDSEKSGQLDFHLRGKDEKLWNIDVLWDPRYLGWWVEAEPMSNEQQMLFPEHLLVCKS